MLLLVSLSCLALYNAQCTCKTHKHGEVSKQLDSIQYSKWMSQGNQIQWGIVESYKKLC